MFFSRNIYALLIFLLSGLFIPNSAFADCPSGFTPDPFIAGVCYDCPSGWERYLLQPNPTASNACTRNRGIITRPASTSSASCTTLPVVGTVCTCPLGQGLIGSTCYRCNSPYARNLLRSWTASNVCEWNPPREFTSASTAIDTCGGEGDRACTITERIPSCDVNLVEQAGRCIRPDCGRLNERACTVVERIPSCDQGLVELINIPDGAICRNIESDGYPNHCGRTGQPPCQITEKIPSCLDDDDFEWAGKCEATGADGYPTFCGDEDQPACNVLLQTQLLILACKPGNFNDSGTCRALDDEGYPENCGDPNEDACTIDQQLLFSIDACKNTAYNDFGTCKGLDSDGYPVVCGGLNEPACLVDEQIRLLITSCKPKLEEVLIPLAVENENFGSICVDSCGGHGLPVCLTGCDAGLSLQTNDIIDAEAVCGKSPENWGETDANEFSPRGPRVVFYIHGRGGDLSGDPNELLKLLANKSTNIAEVYGVDWNNTARAATDLSLRRVLIKKLVDNSWEDVQPYGKLSFNNKSHTIINTAQAISQAIRDINPDQPITVLTHSFGGVIARQLVYRHYDELRDAGHPIAEVLTIKGPHRGGVVGTPDYITTIGPITENGLDTLTDFACTNGRIGDLAGVGAGQDGCQLGAWVKWSLERAPINIDDVGYPQIRWIAMAGHGYRLNEGNINAVLNAPLTLNPFLVNILEDAKDETVVPFNDSDLTVSTRSAFGISVDACFPYYSSTPPNNSATDATIVFNQNTWDEQQANTASCFHANGTLPGADNLVNTKINHDVPEQEEDKDEQAFAFAAIATAKAEFDTDGDNLLDDEHDNCEGVFNPSRRDTDDDDQGDACDNDIDGDGLTNEFEEEYGYDPSKGGEEISDDDGDNLTALEEQALGTRPDKADTDNDTFNDDVEKNAGSDPLDINSTPENVVPNEVQIPLPLWSVLLLGIVLIVTSIRNLRHRGDDYI